MRTNISEGHIELLCWLLRDVARDTACRFVFSRCCIELLDALRCCVAPVASFAAALALGIAAAIQAAAPCSSF